MFDRMLYSDEDGCSYDQQVYVTPLPLDVGLVLVGSLLLVAWAADGEEWKAIADKAQWIWGLLTKCRHSLIRHITPSVSAPTAQSSVAQGP